MEWISIEDRLPLQLPQNIPTYDWVLVTSKYPPNPISIARFDGERWDFLSSDERWDHGAIYGDATFAFDLDEITHWMPLPEPP